jgi:hypothetical protein
LRRAWIMLALLAGCAPLVQAGPEAGGRGAELGSALNVRVEGDSVRFELHLTNIAGAPVVLEFPTAQRYDFEVRAAAGRVLWRWSDEMAHAQVLGREVLAPGESQRYVVVHSRADLAGGRVAYGRLTSTSHPIELQTPIELVE